ncbi:MAG: prepilin-type N-terminal cleavage/methylation domain-containing protein [Clostridia bacterium]|nr:prepilin-type N-terminal cleavage/methylation domain-containing protein [Clostridia bacterium]
MFELMNTQRAKMKKNGNKGFTMIELIVVILIIAIIAVALAPQVVKYVNQSRIATDVNNAATLKSAISTAYADYLANGGEETTFDAVEINGSQPTENMGTAELKKAIDEVLGGDYPATKYDKDGFKVSLNDKGKVTVKCGAQDVE